MTTSQSSRTRRTLRSISLAMISVPCLVIGFEALARIVGWLPRNLGVWGWWVGLDLPVAAVLVGGLVLFLTRNRS